MPARPFLAFLLMLLAVTAHGETRRAGVLNKGDAISITKLLDAPGQFTKKPVLVSGVMQKGCADGGCYMMISTHLGASEGVRVKFSGFSFLIPLDAGGAKVRMEGVTLVRKVSRREADALIAQGTKIRRNADGSAYDVTFVASGIELTR